MAALAWSGITLNLPENSDSRQQRDILDALPVLIFLELAGRIVFANAEARQQMGMAEGEWVQKPVDEVLWGLFSGTAEPRTSLSGSKSGSPFHATLACKGGRMVHVEGNYCILDAEQRHGIIVAQVDGRERAPKPRLMEDVLNSLPEAVAIVHGTHVLYTNPAFTAMFGYAADEVSGGDLRDMIVPETRAHETPMLVKMVDECGRAAIETVRQNKGGELLDVSLLMTPLQVNGDRAGYVLTFRDIADRKHVEMKLQHDAMHDVLTGLPNRALFLDRLKLALSRRERRRDQGCAVLFIDVDQFKKINDEFGHAAGDMLLLAVSERLVAALRPQDTAARMGGDEFAILIESITSLEDIEGVAQRVLSEVDRPFEVLGHRVQTPVSIGIALATDDHADAEAVVRDADVAMYRSKQEGGRRYSFFDRQMVVQISRLQERERELRRVVAHHQLEFWHQPIFRLATGRVEAFESLLRWRKSNGEVDSFGELLPVAEESGLSISIGRDNMDSACRKLLEWDRAVPANGLSIAVNLTERQFYHDHLVEQMRKSFADTGVNPARVIFEVSESTLNTNPDRAVVILQRIVDCSARVALDNFGSSLAPMNHLLRLPLQIVKLDARFTMAASGAGRQLAIVESLIHVCKAVGVQLLAQGIETHEQLSVMHSLGCELGQGFVLAPALDASLAMHLVVRNAQAATDSSLS